SEVMAIFCLATDLEDLKRRLGNIIVGYTREKQPIFAKDLNAHGAMTALLKDAFQPNLVQTLENNPAFIHGGPFANIAHGCNSVLATKTALKLADYVVTEAGFGADLGAEKFLDIKCRKAGLKPEIAVVVATIRALKMHGGVAKADLGVENIKAVTHGSENLARHVENLKKFGLPVIVAINQFSADTKAEVDQVRQICAELGVDAILSDHWGNGGAGAETLAKAVVEKIDQNGSNYAPLYNDALPLWDKVRTIAQTLYGAQGIIADQKVRDQFKELQDGGFGHYPVCIAKTQYSFSTDPNLKGAPSNHVVPIREVRIAGGAEFVVAVCGNIMTMPGLPRVPAANTIDVDENGQIVGLF
uniref:formate--tetrahydrofolate ligase n=1 Tax=Sneathiella sp. TaxID=1964365 RepID=UPI00356A5B0B